MTKPSLPTAEWIARQITEAFPGIRPVASCFGVMTIVRRRLQAMGIRDHPTAPRSP
jgi:hypothetical protein